jgi:fatty-acyl-CoA synthase
MTSSNFNPFSSDFVRSSTGHADDQLRRHTLGDLLHRSAKRFPKKTAIICGQTTWTYATLDALCNRLAAGLSTRGVAKGVRVAILSRNSHSFAALRFALARLGAVLVPINFMLKADEVVHPAACRRRDVGH